MVGGRYWPGPGSFAYHGVALDCRDSPARERGRGEDGAPADAKAAASAPETVPEERRCLTLPE